MLTNHPDTTYLVAQSVLAARRYEAAEERRAHSRPLPGDGVRPVAIPLGYRLPLLAWGKAHLRALSLTRAARFIVG